MDLSTKVAEHARSMSDDLLLAVEAARAAGAVIADAYDGLNAIKVKGVGDFVSDVDYRADREVAQILQADPHQRAILSEELSPDASDMVPPFWIVDPLDGTSAFLFKTGPTVPAVLVALYGEEREIELGVAYFPITGEWFYAQRGRGAYRNGDALHLESAQPSLQEGWVELNQYGDSRLESPSFTHLRRNLRTERGASLVTSSVPHSGSSLRMIQENSSLICVVHDNQAGSIKQAPWDIAAIQVIVEEAGGVAMTVAKGERINPFHTEPFLYARNEAIAQQLRSLVEPASD